MACKDCQPASPITIFPFPDAPCNQPDSADCCESHVPTSCVENNGLPLPCIGADTKEKLDIILQKIDTKLCDISGGTDPYSDFNTFCLQPVGTAKEFAEKTAAVLCQLRSTVTNFTNSVFPAEITAIRDEIGSLDKAGFNYSCPIIDIRQADNLAQTLYKLAVSICDLHVNQADLSAVDWGQCTTAGTLPNSISEGFDFIIDQLCAINNTGTTLPTFDNLGSCLTAATANDTLNDTIIKIRGKLCSLPTFSVSTLSSSCINLAGINTLEQTLAKILGQLDALSKSTIRQADLSQFRVTDADVTMPCNGKKISLVEGATSSDRLVAVTAQDNAPGTLYEKLIAGNGIVIDTANTAGKMTISATATGDQKVKVSASDSNPGYLQQKIAGASGDITTTVTTSADQLTVAATIDYDKLIDRLFDIMETDADVKARFCALVSSCPSPCAPPTNVQAIAVT